MRPSSIAVLLLNTARGRPFLLSTVTVSGTPTEITLSELTVEAP